MMAAYKLDPKQGVAKLKKQAEWLDREHPDTAASLREGLDETFTGQCHGLSSSLTRCLCTTNIIENPDGIVWRTARASRVIAMPTWRFSEPLQGSSRYTDHCSIVANAATVARAIAMEARAGSGSERARRSTGWRVKVARHDFAGLFATTPTAVKEHEDQCAHGSGRRVRPECGSAQYSNAGRVIV